MKQNAEVWTDLPNSTKRTTYMRGTRLVA